MNDIEREFKLEADAVHEGVLRYRQSREYQLATDSKPVRDLLVSCLKALADAILAEQTGLRTSQRQKPPKYAIPLLSLDPEVLALITLATLLNGISSSEFEDGQAPRVTPLAYDIGQSCRIERIYDRLRQREVDLVLILRSRNRSGHAGRRAEEMARKLDDPDDWAKNYHSYHLGEKLIALAVRFAQFDGQPVFVLNTDQEGYGGRAKTTRRIELSKTAEDWLNSHPSALGFLPNPVYMPMVVPPRPRTSLSSGGYLAKPLQLLKRKPNQRAQKLLAKADMSIVYSAVNALQNTAYRISKDAYRIMQPAWDAGDLVFGLKTHSFERLPPRLPVDADPAEIKGRNQQRAAAFKLNNQIKGLTKIMGFRLSTAGRLLDEQRLYFPHQLDHRGRAYPVPQLVNPQSDDIGRCLLEFADGKPLGERGAYWLAIHLANCYFKEKISFEKRLEWVYQRERAIIDFAGNPLRAHPFWDEADKAWCFLRACIEWKGYREQGPGFISHLPVSMDGSCNGYQHLSAMGLDPIGGRATNLVPGAKPADIYQEVANYVSVRLKRDLEAAGEFADLARQLLPLIDRNLVKPATMTTPYGVTRGTIYRQLLDATPVQFCKDAKPCARYLARVLEESIPEIAMEASNIMKWLRDVARALATADRGLAWTTPAGFIVVHEPREPKAIRVATADHTILLHEDDETRKVDARKQADGIVAHLVHSLDAAHMMWTVHRLYGLGLRHFAMVHDSFGVHACDVDLLNRVLREEFVRMYAAPVMQDFFKEQWKANPGVHLPALPPPGSLDIRQVIDSPYFFA